jgi:hypothetical protein
VKRLVRGAHVVGTRNDDYFIKGRPYLDGFRALVIKDTAALYETQSRTPPR